MNNILNSVENMIDKVKKDIVTPLSKNYKKEANRMMEFLQNHKKSIIFIGLVYLVFSYLFKEEEDEE